MLEVSSTLTQEKEHKIPVYNYRFLESPFLHPAGDDENKKSGLAFRDGVRKLSSGNNFRENDAWQLLKRENPWLYDQMKDKVDVRIFDGFLNAVENTEVELENKFLEKFEQIKAEVQGWLAANPEASREEKNNYLERYRAQIYACARLSGIKHLEKRHYNPQVIAGLIMDDGFDLEFPTAEGKTITVTLPAIMSSLEGRGVTIATNNEYLAKRDMIKNGPLYHGLGLQVAFVGKYSCVFFDPTSPVSYRRCSRKEAYKSDVVYGTYEQFAFDLEADKKAKKASDRCRRYDEHGELVVPISYKDEFDNTEMDKSNMPLITQGVVDENGYQVKGGAGTENIMKDGPEKGWILVADRIAKQLKQATKICEKGENIGKIDEESGDFVISGENNFLGIKITDQGWDKVERLLALEKGKEKHDRVFGRILEQQFNRKRRTDTFFFEKEANRYALDRDEELKAEEIVEKRLSQADNDEYKFYDSLNVFTQRLFLSIQAIHLFQENIHYYVDRQSQKIVFIDQSNKRASLDVRFSDGIHQALEAKHHVPIRHDYQIVSRTTLGVYDGLHDKSVGMTGVIPRSLERELARMGRHVMRMPRKIWIDYLMGTINGQMVDLDEQLVFVERSRSDRPEIVERFYMPRKKAQELQEIENEDNFDWTCAYFERTENPVRLELDSDSRISAIIDEISEMHESGRPVIVFTNSVDEAKKIANNLQEREKDKEEGKRIKFRMITALPDDSSNEDIAVALATRPGEVTIATTMAARGTDYKNNVEELEKIIADKVFDAEIEAFDSRENSSQENIENLFLGLEFILTGMRHKSGKDIKESLSSEEFDELLKQLNESNSRAVFFVNANILKRPIQDTKTLLTFYKSARAELIQREGNYVFLHGAMATKLRNEIMGNYIKMFKGETFDQGYLKIFSSLDNSPRDWLKRVSAEIVEKNRMLYSGSEGAGSENLQEEMKRATRAGGLHVIICNELGENDIGELERTVRQAKGRVSREGSRGSASVFYAIRDLEKVIGDNSEYKRHYDELMEIYEKDGEINRKLLKKFLEFVKKLESVKANKAMELRKNIRERDEILSKQLDILQKIRNFVLSCSDDEFIIFRNELEKNLFDAKITEGSILRLPDMKVSQFDETKTTTIYSSFRADALREIDACVIYILEAFENILDLSQSQANPEVYMKIELNRIFQKKLMDLARELSKRKLK